ncbi:MAG: hypothetical protein N2504_04990 [candidate division WOR-3 bacterium]|nr:hypothetical protein [candidate division WOR-3 bacterium]
MGFNIYIACNYLEQKVKRKATRMFNQWKEELKAIRIEYTQKTEEFRKQYEALMGEKVKNLLLEWKQKKEEKIRQDTIAKSMTTIFRKGWETA